MVTKSVPGQLDLFPVDEYSDSTVASNFSSGISQISTRTKAFISPRKITRKVLNEAAIKLASLEPLNSTQTSASAPDLDTRIRWANELRRQAQTNY